MGNGGGGGGAGGAGSVGAATGGGPAGVYRPGFSRSSSSLTAPAKAWKATPAQTAAADAAAKKKKKKEEVRKNRSLLTGYEKPKVKKPGLTGKPGAQKKPGLEKKTVLGEETSTQIM